MISSDVRHCAVCGAPIGEDNPDGIGSTCRAVWYSARKSTFFHFCGLDFWKAKIDFWLPAFLLAFRNTKFRSAFKKSFYSSCFDRYQNGQNFSKKQLDIIKNMLTGCDFGFAKWSDEQIDKSKEYEECLYMELSQLFWRNPTPEIMEYQENCAKKYYQEAATH